MSYAEYMRTRMAGKAVVLETRKPTDSSMETLKRKQSASSVFALGGNFIGSTITGTDRYGNTNACRSYAKLVGKPGDCSSYTNYRGSQAINSNAAYARGRMMQNDNPANCITPPLPKSKYNGYGETTH